MSELRNGYLTRDSVDRLGLPFGLLREHVEDVMRRFLGQNDQDHDDLVQEVMIQLVTSQDRYRGDCTVGTWIHAIAYNVMCKAIRRRMLERKIFEALDEVNQSRARSRWDPEREAAARMVLARLAGHFTCIAPAKASALALHCSGFELREIAELEGLSLAAAQTRVSRGRREIRALLMRDPEFANALETLATNHD